MRSMMAKVRYDMTLDTIGPEKTLISIAKFHYSKSFFSESLSKTKFVTVDSSIVN